MRKLANSPGFHQIYTKYLKIYQDYNQTYMANMKLHNERDFKENVTVLEQLDDIYFYVKHLLEKSRKDIYNTIEKYGITAKDLDFVVAVRGVIQDKFTLISSYENVSFNDPVESVINDGNHIYKCFTFNSFLKNYTRAIKIKLKQMYISMKISSDIFPKLDFRPNSLLISIHSPNALPHLNDMSELDHENEHNFHFSQVNTELLGEGFETDCFEYDLDYKFANFNMRSDCITECVRNLYEQTEEHGYCNFSNYPVRTELLDQERNFKKCDSEEPFYNDIDEVFTDLEHKCNKRCQMDCNFRYYLLHHKETRSGFQAIYTKILIWIDHNSLPDILIKYLPQTIFISFRM